MNLVQIAYRPKKEHYILLRGRETFYNDDNYLIAFGTPKEAAEWLRVNHPEYELDPDSVPNELQDDV